MGQAVDDQVVSAGLAQVEGFDRDPIDRDSDLVPFIGNGEIELLHDLFETERPADVRAERKPDQPSLMSQVSAPGRAPRH